MSNIGMYKIRSVARGSHWIAWTEGETDGKPLNSVVLVGRTQDEAENRAVARAEKNNPGSNNT
jgi:hypothetical protein